MTNQYSIPLAVNRANAFFTRNKLNTTLLFDTPIPPGVIPPHQRQPNSKQQPLCKRDKKPTPKNSPNKRVKSHTISIAGLGG